MPLRRLDCPQSQPPECVPDERDSILLIKVRRSVLWETSGTVADGGKGEAGHLRHFQAIDVES